MMSKRHAQRSDQEWLRLITECRQSGMSDYAWCAKNDIPSSSFYNAISRLRKKACAIPEPDDNTMIMDLTSRKQDVVQIDIVPDRSLEPDIPAYGDTVQPHLDNPYTIEIVLDNRASLRVNNSADPVLLEKVIGMIGRTSC